MIFSRSRAEAPAAEGRPGRNDLCWCKSGKKYKKCHMQSDVQGETTPRMIRAQPTVLPGKVSPLRTVPSGIVRPPYAIPGHHRPSVRRSCLKTTDEIPPMRDACRAARKALDVVIAAVKPGVSTESLDQLAHETIVAMGGYPSTLHYGQFPKSICTSVNEVICHGIPDDRILREGDIVNVDLTMYIHGFHGDCSETVFVGRPSEEAQRLVETTWQCMQAGIMAVSPGKPLNLVGRAVQTLAEGRGYSVVRDFLGHGVGADFHMEPEVAHHFDPSHRHIMKPGMTFTIEPMINQGVFGFFSWKDNWTAVTADLKLSAQFEHTVLVTSGGVEILTAYTLPEGPYFIRQLREMGIKPLFLPEDESFS